MASRGEAKTSQSGEGSAGGAAEPPHLNSTILAIDHGLKRIGLAIKPAGQTMALPMGVVRGEPETEAIRAIQTIVVERKVQSVVVGLPMHANPEQGRIVKRFTRKLRRGISGVRWFFIDEALTSREAESRHREAEFRSRRPVPDDRAAALILETFIQAEATRTAPDCE